MTDDELIAKAEKELASLTRCMSPDKVAKLEAHRLIALARIGAGEMARERQPREFSKHLRDVASKHMDGKLETEISAALHNAANLIDALSSTPPSVGEDVVKRMVRAFKAVLLDIDFLIERGHLTDIRNDMIYTEARAALAAIGRT